MAKKPYSTSIEETLVKKLKILAVYQEKKVNNLLEEAIELLLKKYEDKK